MFYLKNELRETTRKKHSFSPELYEFAHLNPLPNVCFVVESVVFARTKAPVHAPTEMALACISCLVVD